MPELADDYWTERTYIKCGCKVLVLAQAGPTDCPVCHPVLPPQDDSDPCGCRACTEDCAPYPGLVP